MNYLNMVDFIEVTNEYVLSKLCCQKREEYFRFHFDTVKIVPSFIILEAIFQTAGRVAREKHANSMSGGIIASFRKFAFSRPIFANEDIRIKATLISDNEKSFYFQIKIFSRDHAIQEIMKSGALIIAKLDSLEGGQFSTASVGERDIFIEKFQL